MSANRTVILYFRDRMNDAGYDAKLGFNVPDFARSLSGKIGIELWLSNGEFPFWQNQKSSLEPNGLIECYVYRTRSPDDDSEGLWYDDVEGALNALTDNDENRDKQNKLWWDNEIVSVDFVSPLKRWNNASEYAAKFICARIDLPIHFLTNIT